MQTILVVLAVILIVIQYYQYHYQTTYYKDLDRRFSALINSFARKERMAKNDYLQSQFAGEHIARLNRICKTASECQLNELTAIVADMPTTQSALLIAILAPELVVRVLSSLPEDKVSRIIEDILTGAIENLQIVDLTDIMARLHETHEKSVTGNMLSVAELFYFLDTEKERQLIAAFSYTAKHSTLKPYLINWNDIVNIDDRILQTVLREVSNENLLYALFKSTDEIIDKFASNMSRRAATMLRQDLASQANVPEKKVIGGRKELLFAIVKERLND